MFKIIRSTSGYSNTKMVFNWMVYVISMVMTISIALLQMNLIQTATKTLFEVDNNNDVEPFQSQTGKSRNVLTYAFGTVILNVRIKVEINNQKV